MDRAKVDSWSGQKVALAPELELVPTGLFVGAPPNQGEIFWFYANRGVPMQEIPGTKNQQTYRPTQKGFFYCSPQINHGTDSSQGGLPSSSWYDGKALPLQPFTRGWSRAITGGIEVT